jgi:hypothetical protein
MSRKPRRDNHDESCDKGEIIENIEDLKKYATDCIRLFFKDKKYFCGGPVPERELKSEFAQQTVLKTQFDDRCFDFIHEVCLPVFPVDKNYNETTVPWTVHCLLGLLTDLKSFGIPKDSQPGLLLLYFKFCHGIEIPPPPLL